MSRSVTTIALSLPLALQRHRTRSTRVRSAEDTSSIVSVLSILQRRIVITTVHGSVTDLRRVTPRNNAIRHVRDLGLSAVEVVDLDTKTVQVTMLVKCRPV